MLLLLGRFSRVRLWVRPHRWQPTRLHRPWDSPGKNIGVGCHLEGYIFAFITAQCIIWASLVAQMVKHLPAMRETRVGSLGWEDWEDLLEKEMATHSRILAGESHGWRSLVGYSPWGRKRSDMTERLHCHFQCLIWSFLDGASAKELACQCRRCKRSGFNPWVRKIPWRRAWQPTRVLLSGEFQGQRSLVGYSP